MNLLLSDSKRTSTNPQLMEPPYLAHGLTGSLFGSLTGLFYFLIGLGSLLTIQLDFHRAPLLPGRCFTTARRSTAPPLQSAFFSPSAAILQGNQPRKTPTPCWMVEPQLNGHSILPGCPSVGGNLWVYGYDKEPNSFAPRLFVLAHHTESLTAQLRGRCLGPVCRLNTTLTSQPRFSNDLIVFLLLLFILQKSNGI